MDLPVFLPSVKPRSTKDGILRLLTEHRELTNKQLHVRMARLLGISVSYQAVRQALAELGRDGVLAKRGRHYRISPDWIRRLHEYSSLLKKKYLDRHEVVIVDEKTTEISLRSLDEMGNFLMHGFREHFFDVNREHDLHMYVHHLWFPFFSREKRRKLDSFFRQNENRILVGSRSLVDRVFAIYYRRYGTVKLGARVDAFFDIIIQGDCVAKVHMPSALRKRMDRAYGRRNPFRFDVIDEFSDITFADYRIKIIITRDRALAEDLKRAMDAI